MKKAIFLLSMIALTAGLSAQDTRTRAPRNVQEKSTETREAVKKNETNDNQKAATVTPPPTRTRSAADPVISKPENRNSSSSQSRSVQTTPSGNSRAVQRDEAPSRDNSSTRSRTAPTNPNPAGNTDRTRSVGPRSGNEPGTVNRTTTNKSTTNRSKTSSPVENDPKYRSREGNKSGTVTPSRSNAPESGRSSTSGQVRSTSTRTVNKGVEQGRASDNRREATTTKGNTYERRTTGSSGKNYSGSNHYDPKVGQTYSEQRRVYVTPAPRRIARPAPVINYVYRPVEYRRIHHPYIAPARVNIYWTRNMYREYVYLYPEYNLWYYPYGYRIESVSAYDASAFIGEVANVFGRVYETWYLRDNDEYYLYFGGPYPYHDFSIVLKGKDARRFSRNPERFFENRNVAVTGLVSLWEGKPEIVVKKRNQIDLY